MRRQYLFIMLMTMIVVLAACGGATEPAGEGAASEGAARAAQEEIAAEPAEEDMPTDADMAMSDDATAEADDAMVEMSDEGMSSDQPMEDSVDTVAMEEDGDAASMDDEMSGDEMDGMDHEAEPDEAMSDSEMMEDAAVEDPIANEEMDDGGMADEEMAGDDMASEESSMPQPELAAWQQLTLTNAQTGDSFTLADFAGKTIFVEPMATWCSNCRLQLRNVREARAQLGDEVVFIALSVETNISDADLAAYQQREGFDWIFAVMTPEMLQLLVDEFGRVTANPPSTPHFLIRPDGSFTELVIGIDSPEELLQMIQAAAG